MERHKQHIRAKECFAFHATDTSFMKYFEAHRWEEGDRQTKPEDL